MRDAILQASFSSLAYLAFTNGLILLYLSAQRLSSERIVLYLAVPAIGNALLLMPCAYLCDRYGKRRMGLIGIVCETIGFSALASSSSFAAPLNERMAALGITLHTVGATLYVAGWFALLSPIVPEKMRGKFFGRLRITWQIVAVVFVAVCGLLISTESELRSFQWMMVAMIVGLVIRIPFYARLPELERSGFSEHFFTTVVNALRRDGFTPFCAYIFLLALFTVGCPVLFGLIEKRVLGFGDNVIIWLGTLSMVGAILGFFAGGKLVDRWGTKPVFLICHVAYCALLFAFLARSVIPGATVYVVSLVNLGYGVVWASSSIAISTEMLGLIPPKNKSLTTSMFMVMWRAGGALSGVVTAWVLSVGALNESWSLWGQTLSRYDTILLAFAVMILLLVVTLGLVPSVLRKAEWVPR